MSNKDDESLKRLSKQQSRKRWAEIRQLVCEWDPIGVMDDPKCPRDEYDCLLSPLLRRLESGTPEEEIAAFLRREIEEHFGLDPKHYDFPLVAKKLHTWYSKNWPSTRS